MSGGIVGLDSNVLFNNGLMAQLLIIQNGDRENQIITVEARIAQRYFQRRKIGMISNAAQREHLFARFQREWN